MSSRRAVRPPRARLVGRVALWGAVAWLLGGLGFAIIRGLPGIGEQGNSSFSGNLRQGGLVQSFSLPALGREGTLDYDEFRGRPLVLNFFASWCPFCIAEMPAFEQVHQDLGGNVAFVGVAQRDTRAAAEALVNRTGVTYPAALDGAGRFYDALGTLGMPTTLFIEPGGRIGYLHVGPLDERSLRTFIQQYLGVTA